MVLVSIGAFSRDSYGGMIFSGQERRVRGVIEMIEEVDDGV
jgi:hypothetical protein